ncbi:MAG: hypothetical protein KC643_04500 [Nitrospira sp.]|nr:hypothetical protein [Nitrospira sp.]
MNKGKTKAMTECTFEGFDKFGRKEFADRLTTVITKFSPFYDGAFVLSLNGKFGSGKTTFLEMWKQDLEMKKFEVVYINAWETDFEDEPLIPLLGAILEKLNEHTDNTKLQDALKGVMGATVTASDQLLSKFTGIKGKEVYQSYITGNQTEDIQKVGETLYATYTFKKNAYGELKEKLSNYLKTIQEKPLIIFVDELDRARPDYSIRFLEAIKHIFPIQGICFVLAVDRGQLEISVKQLYGSLDFDNYYARFITREATLPAVTATKMGLMPFLQCQAKDYFDQKTAQGINFPFSPDQQREILEHMARICRIWELTPRQIEYLFRIFSQLMVVTSDTKANVHWINAAILLIAIFIKNTPLYHSLGKGECKPKNLFDYLANLSFNNDSSASEKRFLLFSAMAFRMRDHEDELHHIAELCINYDGPSAGLQTQHSERISETIQSLGKLLGPFWHPTQEYAFQNIYKRLEEWRNFLE